MLILAGVTLNLVIGNNGIIKKAGEAQGAAEQGATNDQIGMNSLYYEMVGLETGTGGGPGGGSGDTIGKVAVGEETSKNSTINGEAPSAYNPIIPEGYIPINTDTTSWGNGTTAPTEESVNKGLVITDSVDASGASNGNEWVWVPVPTPSSLYVTANPAISITGGSGKTVVSDVSTSKYTKSEIISGQTRGKPNDTSSYREPDVVVYYGTIYDAVDTNRAAAGFTKTINGTTTTMTISEMAQTMVKDYDDMIKSLEKYKGFYIGRYELSSAGVKKNQPTLTNTDWYNLYAKCKTLNASDKVTTRMIWGLQWDATCNWIANNGDKKSITDSKSWGNYSNSDGNAAVKNDDGSNAYGSKQNTGFSEYWKANNIYDLAGNCTEWTQEACNLFGRVLRGRSLQ